MIVKEAIFTDKGPVIDPSTTERKGEPKSVV